MNIRRVLKVMISFLLVVVACGVVYAGISFSFIYHASKTEPTAQADTMIILGSKVIGDPAYPSEVLQERLDSAIEYLEEYPFTIVIVTGGQGADESASEASVMRTYLVDHGIADNRILIEDQSTSTKENLQNAKTLYDLDKTVIVTNDFHMYRALAIAKEVGIEEASGLPAVSKTSFTAYAYLREILAVGYLWIFG